LKEKIKDVIILENEILINIKNRRSIRNYKSQQVPKDILERILETALYAPSGSNHKLSLFTAIQNDEILNELNEIVRKALVNSENLTNSFIEAAKRRAENPKDNFFYHAPTLIIGSNLSGYPNAIADCAVAIENMMLAAHSIGVGSCWINQLRWLDEDLSIRNFLDKISVPKEHMICGALALGYMDGAMPNSIERKWDSIQIIK